MLGFKKKASTMFKTMAFMVALAFISAIIGADILRAKTSHAALLNLPEPGQMLSLSKAYSMPQLRGLKFDPLNPLNVSFYIDPGSAADVDQQEASKLVRYFLSALTIPEKDVWVNLSPYENDRVVEENLGVTDMGRDLLAQDYVLKQLSASLTHPETSLGKDYWESTYETLLAETGSTSLPVNTFNKVWIMPSTAEVYEENGLALITDSKLTAMLEEDYLALGNNVSEIQNNDYIEENTIEDASAVSSRMMKEILLPKVIEDVNQGQNFANLRQIYNAQILAAWFKNKFEDSFYANYINGKKTGGIDTIEEQEKEKIFDLYVEAFQKGVYDFVKKEYDASTNRKVKKRYFSGGYVGEVSTKLTMTDNRDLAASTGRLIEVSSAIGAVKNGIAGLAKNSKKAALLGVSALLIGVFGQAIPDQYVEQSFDGLLGMPSDSVTATDLNDYVTGYSDTQIDSIVVPYLEGKLADADTTDDVMAQRILDEIEAQDTTQAEIVIDSAQVDTALVDTLAPVLSNASLVYTATTAEEFDQVQAELRTAEVNRLDSLSKLDANDPAAVQLQTELDSIRTAIRISSEKQAGTVVSQEFRFGSKVLGSQDVASEIFQDDFNGAVAVTQQMITGQTRAGNTEAVELLQRQIALLRRAENVRVSMQNFQIRNTLERSDIFTANQIQMGLEAIQEAAPDLYWGQVLNAVNKAQNDSAFVNSIENDSLKEMIIIQADSLAQLQIDSATVAGGLDDVLLDSTHADSIPSWQNQYNAARDSVVHYDSLITQAEAQQGDTAQAQIYLDSMTTLETEMKTLMPDTTVFDETTIVAILAAFDGGSTDEYIRITTAIREKGLADGLTNAQINDNLIAFRNKVLEYGTMKDAYDAIETGDIDVQIEALRERKTFFEAEELRLYNLLFGGKQYHSLEYYQETIKSTMISIEELVAQAAYGVDLQAKADFEAQLAQDYQRILNTNGIGNSAQMAVEFARATIDNKSALTDLRMEIVRDAIALSADADALGGTVANEILSQTAYSRALANTPQGFYTGAESSNYGFFTPWGVLKLGDLSSQAGQFGVYYKLGIGTQENIPATQRVGVTFDGAKITGDTTGAVTEIDYSAAIGTVNSIMGNQLYNPAESEDNTGYAKEISDFLGFEFAANASFDRMTGSGLKFGASTAFMYSATTELTDGLLDMNSISLLASNSQLRFSPLTSSMRETLSENGFARTWLSGLEAQLNYGISNQAREWQATPLDYSGDVIASGSGSNVFTDGDITVKTNLLGFMMGLNSDYRVSAGVPFGSNVARFAYGWNNYHGVINERVVEAGFERETRGLLLNTNAGLTFDQDGFERINLNANVAQDRWTVGARMQFGRDQMPILGVNTVIKFGFAKAAAAADSSRRANNYTAAVTHGVDVQAANMSALASGQSLNDTALVGIYTDLNGDEVNVNKEAFLNALDSAQILVQGDVNNPSSLDFFMLTQDGYAQIRGASVHNEFNQYVADKFVMPVYENRFDPSDSLHTNLHVADTQNIAATIEGIRAEGQEVFHIGQGRLVIARQSTEGTVTDEIRVPGSFRETYLNDVFGAQAQSNGVAGATWYLANDGRLMYETFTEEELNLMKERNQIRRSSLPGSDGRRDVLAVAPVVEGATPHEVVLNDVGQAAFAGISTDSLKANYATQVAETVIDTVETDSTVIVAALADSVVVVEEDITDSVEITALDYINKSPTEWNSGIERTQQGRAINVQNNINMVTVTNNATGDTLQTLLTQTIGTQVKTIAVDAAWLAGVRADSNPRAANAIVDSLMNRVDYDGAVNLTEADLEQAAQVNTIGENIQVLELNKDGDYFYLFKNTATGKVEKFVRAMARTRNRNTLRLFYDAAARLPNASSALSANESKDAVGGIDFDNVRSLVKTKAGSSAINFPKLNMAKLDGLTFVITKMQETTGAKVLAYAK